MFFRVFSCLFLVTGLADIFLQACSIPAEAQSPVDVLSYHGGDTTSVGVNSAEQQLMPSSVNVATFQKQFGTDITDIPNTTGIPASDLPSGYNYTAAAGQVYAEPLVKTGVTITTGSYQGLHDVVFVATSMDSLYAIDADGGTVLWKDSFIYNAAGNPNPVNAAIPSGVTAVPGGTGTELKSGDINPWVGIVDTPVIDGVNGYIYFIAKTREARGSNGEAQPDYVQTLHKVRLSDGLDAKTVIADTTLLTSTTYTYNSGPFVVGTSGDAITVSGEKRVYFNAVRQMVRPALMLYSGRIYIASASHGDNGPYHGWILTYNASTLALNGVWNATPNGSDGEGGIWQGGGGVVIDPANGYIYFATGNGDFDGSISNNVVSGLDANGFPSNGNYGDCFVKLALDSTTSQDSQGTNKNGWGLKVVDYFSPYNNQILSNGDQDLGSGGPTLLPDSAGSTSHPHLLMGGGKEGKLYLMDRDNMGKFGVTDSVVQTLSGVLDGILSVPAYFNGRLYATPAYGGTTVSWALANATIETSSLQQSSDQIGFPGCSPYITANGTTNGVLWEIDKSSGQLRAYDASNLASELWTSNQNATRDSLGSAVKFACPTPVNGRVYVGTADHLIVYGPPGAPTAPPAAPTDLTAEATGPSTISIFWTDNSNNESGFNIERSSDGTNFTRITTVGVNQTTFGDSGLSSQATYYYRVRASNAYDTVSYSAYTNVASATTPSSGAIDPVYLYHFDEGTGTTTADSISGNNGTLIGATLPAWVSPGHIGNSSLSFSGDGQYVQQNESAVQVNSDLSTILGESTSLLFWIKTTQSGNDTHYEAPAVTGVEALGNDDDINWGYLDSTGHIGVAVGDSGSVLSVNPINDGQWHQIALTRDSTVGTVGVYVDGNLSSTGTLGTGRKTSPFYLIGALSVDYSGGLLGANFFNGQLDDVQIYGVVVNAAFIAAIAQPPAAPTNLVVVPASGTELDLSWNDNASNETGYEVWRSISGGSFTRIAQLPANSVSYMNGSLTQGTSYAYFVRAVNSAGSSSSNTVNSATPDPPATPSGATVTLLSPTEIDLRWVDNATNETGYTVLRRTGTADFSPVGTLPANTTAFKDTTVSAGVTYDYHIEAYNIAGYSDFTGLTVTTPVASQMAAYFTSYNLPANSAPGAISNPDGVPNLLEYAFNLNPLVDNLASLPSVGQQSGYVTISFVGRIAPTDLTYTVEVSGDLIHWYSGAAHTTTLSVTPIDSVTQTVKVRDNTPFSGTVPRFIRVNVAQ